MGTFEPIRGRLDLGSFKLRDVLITGSTPCVEFDFVKSDYDKY